MDKTIDLGIPVPPDREPDWSAILDPERLLRLHPHWHVEGVETVGDGIKAHLKDHATEQQLTFSFDVAFPKKGAFLITCDDGPATKIHFYPQKGQMHVSFSLRGESLSPEEEQNLTLWLQSIRQYLRLYLTTTPYTLFFRFLMNRALLKMNPSQRKISLMLYRFTVLELVVILIIVVGYFALGR